MASKSTIDWTQEVAILLEGPRHKRVYYEDELDMGNNPVGEGYRRTGRMVSLAAAYPTLAEKNPLRTLSCRVWEHVETAEARQARKAGAAR